MSFTSITFLFIFLPVALLLFFLATFTKSWLREIILLACSLLFYACGAPNYFLLLILLTCVDVLFSWGIGKVRREGRSHTASKTLLIIGIVINIGVLCGYHYYDTVMPAVKWLFGASFTLPDVVLPLGLSYFTFKAVSLFTDAYRGDVETNRPLSAALYLTFFAQIQSGPVARYADFAAGSVKRGRQWFASFSKGAVRFMAGFSKKILIADVLAHIVTEVFDETAQLSVPLAWLGAICFSLQLFFDFSGYSDMAIGVCAMFGYDCPENFNYPYMTKSISEFWRRWHISLGAWFRDYVYIPLGGSRAGKWRLYRNLFIVWLLTGMWHGAGFNFIAWGLGYFVLIAFEKATSLPERLHTKPAKFLYRIFTLLMINFLWVLFRSADLPDGLLFLKAMFVPSGYAYGLSRAAFLLGDYAAFMIAAVILAVPIVPALGRLCEKTRILSVVYHVVYACAVMGFFVCALVFVINGLNNPFLYGNF